MVLVEAPLSARRCSALTYFASTPTGYELLGEPLAQNTLAAVQLVDEGLMSGGDLGYTLDDDELAENQEHIKNAGYAIDQHLNVKSITALLKNVIVDTRPRIKSLLRGDNNAKYFTFLDFQGPFPRAEHARPGKRGVLVNTCIWSLPGVPQRATTSGDNNYRERCMVADDKHQSSRKSVRYRVRLRGQVFGSHTGAEVHSADVNCT